MAGKGTPATAQLSRLGVPYTLRTYEHDPRHESFGAEAADALGIARERVFKTLVANIDGTLTVGVVPVTGQLNLKALAAAVTGKKARMADAAAAQRATGYVLGGISPFGQRNTLPVVVDTSAREHATVHCSGGRRGLEIELAPDDLITVIGAVVADITT